LAPGRPRTGEVGRRGGVAVAPTRLVAGGRGAIRTAPELAVWHGWWSSQPLLQHALRRRNVPGRFDLFNELGADLAHRCRCGIRAPRLGRELSSWVSQRRRAVARARRA